VMVAIVAVTVVLMVSVTVTGSRVEKVKLRSVGSTSIVAGPAEPLIWAMAVTSLLMTVEETVLMTVSVTLRMLVETEVVILVLVSLWTDVDVTLDV